MLPLTDALLGWIVGVVGDAGLRLTQTPRDHRRLRRLLDQELAQVVPVANPDVRAPFERALRDAISVPVRLAPDSGVPLIEALRSVVVSQLQVLREWVDQERCLSFTEATGIEPDDLVGRVADAILRALRNYVAATGIPELVHALDAAEVTTKLDAISFQLAGLVVSGRGAATFTLPHDISTFTGRREHLSRLIELGSEAVLVGAHAISIHAIDGMAGIGKTALAVHAAHLLADRYPDGRMFLHLHGHTPGQRPVEPVDALGTLLLTAGIPAGQIPADVGARTALWRDWVGTRRMLLVLDDAVTSEQVRPILPGSAQALVLITSRRRLTALNEVVSMSLDTLPGDEAAELFTRLAARQDLAPSDPDVAKIVRLCGYLPLAIRLTAAQLAHHSAWTLDELVSDLASTKDRIAAMRAESDSVASAFDLSYHDLSGDQQLLFRRLGLYVGSDFDAYIAAALTGFELPTAQRVLDELYLHHLIEEPGRGRYRMHDLIKEQARALAAREDVHENEAAIDRLLGYFLHTALSAARHTAGRTPVPLPPLIEYPPAWAPDFAAAAAAIAWLQVERTNLAAAVDTAQARTIPIVAIHLPVAITQFLRGQGYWDQAIALTRSGQDVARKVNDPAGEALALLSRATVHRIAGEYPDAIACLERSIALCRSIVDRVGEASGLHELGVLQRMMFDYPAAEAAQATAREIYAELHISLGEANTHNEIGVMRWLVGDLPGALESQTRARDLYRENGNAYGLAIAYGEMALVNNQIGNYPAAAANASSSIGLHREAGNRYAEAITFKFLGATQYLTGDTTASIQILSDTVDLDRELGSRYEMGFALRELGVALLRAGDFRGARTVLIQSVATHREFASHYGEGLALAALGRAQAALNDLDDSAASLTGALRLHQEFGFGFGQADALLGLADLAMRHHDLDTARQQYAAALTLARVCGAQLEEGQALAGLADCAAAAGDATMAAEGRQAALSILERIGAPDGAGVRDRL